MIPGMGGTSLQVSDTTKQTTDTTIDAALRASGVRGLIANQISSGSSRLAASTSAADSGSPTSMTLIIAGVAGLALFMVMRRR